MGEATGVCQPAQEMKPRVLIVGTAYAICEHRKKLEELQQLRHLLGEVFRTSDTALEWIHSPVPALGGKTPLLVMTEGQVGRLVQLLAGIRTGAHT